MSKLKFLLLFFVLAASLSSHAKLTEKQGYLITWDHDTLYGTLKLRLDYKEDLFYARIQFGVFFQDSLNDLKLVKPDEVLGFVFQHTYQEIKFLSLPYYNNYRLFLKVVNDDGPLILLEHFKDLIDTRTNYGELSYYLLSHPASSKRDYFVFLKPDGVMLKYSKYSGKKKIGEFFSDYPELQMKIKRGLYGFTAVYRMVREYNNWKNEGSGF